jgi:hypothetical protein
MINMSTSSSDAQNTVEALHWRKEMMMMIVVTIGDMNNGCGRVRKATIRHKDKCDE